LELKVFINMKGAAMRKVFVNAIPVLMVILTIFIFNAIASAPSTMVYQGRLADIDGNAIVGETVAIFTIYSTPDGTAADSLWAEEIMITSDIQGVFTTELGLTVPLSTTVFDGSVRYMGIKVGEDSEMSPRQLLASAPYAINSNISSGSIYNAQINAAAAIAASKISGTAATLNATQKFTGTNTFFDSSLIVSQYGVKIGDNDVPSYNETLLKISRNYNHSSSYMYGIWDEISTTGTGPLVGNYIRAASSATSAGTMYGIYVNVDGTGTNYASYFNGYGTGDYAGYFYGNVSVVGTLSKSAGSFKIDHPLDPTNKYLCHSFVESPDMMNVYNGNIVTDRSGYAVVDLPDYFNALNKDFRYQLTVIGDFAQAIVAEEINGNQFTIRTDKPSIKVSWQVTGIRKDAFAEQNRIQVEIDKPAIEKGKYLHPEAYQLGEEMQIHYQMNKEAQKANGEDHE